jgi:selenocysteine lyase/cysteine desulfurase
MLQSRRDLFDVPRDVCFLNAAAWSPLPKSAVIEGKMGVERKSRPWSFPIELEQQEIERARTNAASLINASCEDVSIISSVSYGVAIAAKILNLPSGSRVLTLDNDHSSPALEWMTRTGDRSVEVEAVCPDDDHDWTEAVLKAATDKRRKPPALVSISSVHWSDGGVVDLQRVQKVLKQQGTMLLVDATHSVGVLSVDVMQLDPDFLIFPTYKWLLGPYGRAFIYLAKRHQNGIPLEQTGYGRKQIDSADDRYFTDLDYVSGARRYDMGERDFFISLGIASNSMELIRSWGVDAVRGRMSMLTQRIAEALADRRLPVTMLREDLRAPHVLSLGFPGGMPAGLEKNLAHHWVYAASRLGRLRIGPHVYNDETDCDRFVNVLAQVLKQAT